MFNKKLIGMGITLILAILISACTMGQTPTPTEDVSIISTQAMALVATQFSMQQTQTALAIPPTPLPSPTLMPPTLAPLNTPFGGGTPFTANTPFGASTPFGGTPSGFLTTPTTFGVVLPTKAGPQCDDAAFISDATIPDGTVLKPGEDFYKAWTLQNTGTCTWDTGYTLVYQGGSLDGYNIKFAERTNAVKPGEIFSVGVKLTASLVPNKYTECWVMRNDRGSYFGPSPLACVTIEVKK